MASFESKNASPPVDTHLERLYVVFPLYRKLTGNLKTPLQSSQLYTYFKTGGDTNQERDEVPVLGFPYS